MSDYEIKNLREIEDMAVKHGFSETQEARFPREDSGRGHRPGLSRRSPGKRQRSPIAMTGEEVNVVLSGTAG